MIPEDMMAKDILVGTDSATYIDMVNAAQQRATSTRRAANHLTCQNARTSATQFLVKCLANERYIDIGSRKANLNALPNIMVTN